MGSSRLSALLSARESRTPNAWVHRLRRAVKALYWRAVSFPHPCAHNQPYDSWLRGLAAVVVISAYCDRLLLHHHASAECSMQVCGHGMADARPDDVHEGVASPTLPRSRPRRMLLPDAYGAESIERVWCWHGIALASAVASALVHLFATHRRLGTLPASWLLLLLLPPHTRPAGWCWWAKPRNMGRTQYSVAARQTPDRRRSIPAAIGCSLLRRSSGATSDCCTPRLLRVNDTVDY